MKRAIFFICLFLAANLGYSQSTITIKKGETKTLTAFGGSGKVIKWYSGSCGGTLVGTGEKIKVTPTKTTTYYGRWEDGKKVSDCQTVTIIVVDEPVVKPVTTKKDTVYIKRDTVIYKTDTVIREKETVKEVTKTVKTPANTTTVTSTKTYSFGKYTGGMKNGVPNGQGTMSYTKRVRIAKHDSQEHYAEAGYSLVGTWINGDISNGKLIDNKGNVVEIILAGARNSVYNLENDN